MFWTLLVGGGTSGYRYFQVCSNQRSVTGISTNRIGELIQAFALSLGCTCVCYCGPGNDVKVATAAEDVRQRIPKTFPYLPNFLINPRCAVVASALHPKS